MHIIGRAVPPKVLGCGFFVLLASCYGFMREYPATTLGVLIASALCFYGARANKRLTSEEWMVAAAFYVPTLVLFGYSYNEGAELRRFNKYLVAHHCVFAREDILRATAGSCDSRTGMCDEGGEITEEVFACRNGNEITFREFAAGGFGKPLVE
ncbi:hypothetical protein VSR17_16860 [Cupriavidus taiwanensis]|uniref:hypothetical protein n=1 Tax=Cupriavidus taiwanensis TaxID=164546 RepID=UPI000E12817F|nr:hypothetical protein [Cupriavidus taiwanensis]SOY48751.1 hypothetical protein CBM2588_A160037 [Cupriavidus taiwanensis]SOZ23170.1 hypothetical protein CBM2608_A220042 [Cupriavidus taiwanensis]SPA45063.1 hypothetical protein CBM2629_A190033 [Cupriavidus taiwanensis]